MPCVCAGDCIEERPGEKGRPDPRGKQHQRIRHGRWCCRQYDRRTPRASSLRSQLWLWHDSFVSGWSCVDFSAECGWGKLTTRLLARYWALTCPTLSTYQHLRHAQDFPARRGHACQARAVRTRASCTASWYLNCYECSCFGLDLTALHRRVLAVMI